MKKIIQIIKKNIVGFILGVIVAIVISSYAASQLASSSVYYNNANSGGSSNTVSGALDELYDLANKQVAIDPDTFNTNTAKTVYASSKGVCIKRNGKLNCFKINNRAEEQNHIQEVFSDVSCNVYSAGLGCDASDFYCRVLSDGRVICGDYSDRSFCVVGSDGSVSCS